MTYYFYSNKEKLTFLFLTTIILSVAFISATTLNSTNYSGSNTAATSSGNLTSSGFSGNAAAFHQQGISNVNATTYGGRASFLSFTSPPIATVTTIKNKTYISGVNMPLNFTLDNNADYVFYNINGTQNITLNGNSSINATAGRHNLNFYSNNTYGLNYSNTTFTVNSSLLRIIYSNYHANGSSTDFNKTSFEDLQSLSGIILEKDTIGKIVFNEAINVTNDQNLSDREINLDNYTNISNNLIEIDTTVLPNFNVSATLTLEGLTFVNPRVLKDGSLCPSSVCTEVSYVGGVFVFNVTSFSSYSAEETSEESEETPTTSTGGGGGSVVSSGTFIIDRNRISVTLSPGQVKTEEIVITNTGTQSIRVSIENLFTDFVIRSEDVVVLNPGESKVIQFYVIARVDTVPDLYLGKIFVGSGSARKEVLISVEVESEGILLDVRAEIDRGHKEVLSGEEILAEIRLFNLGGDSERKDVEIEYIIKSDSGQEIAKEHESLAVETQASFLKRISIPENAPLGQYTLYVRAIYDGKVASASDNFEIVSSKVTRREKVYIVTLIILSVILSFIIYLVILHLHGESRFRRAAKKGVEERIDLRGILRR